MPDKSKLIPLLAALRAYADEHKIAGKSGYHLEKSRWHADHPGSTGADHMAEMRRSYQDQQGLGRTPLTEVKKLDPAYSAKVGAAYDRMPEWDARALPAYQALIDEVQAQHDHLVKAGYKYTLHYDPHEPYSDSHAMRQDLHDNGHMHVYATASGFGGDPFEHHYKLENGVNVPIVPRPNPLLQHVPGLSTPERPVVANDLFRFVHDAFGHGIHPHQFGPLGEDNAYREHMTMFTPLAQQALTTETRGQNSWVNFGPHMQRKDGTFPKKGDPDFVPAPDRPFADQKIALLPDFATSLDAHDTKVKSYAADDTTDPHDWDEPRHQPKVNWGKGGK